MCVGYKKTKKKNMRPEINQRSCQKKDKSKESVGPEITITIPFPPHAMEVLSVISALHIAYNKRSLNQEPIQATCFAP